MPPPRETPDQGWDEGLEIAPGLAGWVRGSLLGLALGLATIFSIAFWLDPYQADGTPRRLATHRQLGLAPCTFRVLSGLPCPSCGMTTSFALLVRGDAVNSFRANSVGMLLALMGMVALPWSLASVWKRQTLFVRSVEQTGTYLVLGFLCLMIVRWVLVLAFDWRI